MAGKKVRDELVAEARARQRAAQQKLHRLSKRGIDTAGLDPRSGSETLDSLNTRQLRNYINRLNRFVDRSNSYVAGIKGAPLSGSTWRAYQRAERMNNTRAAAYWESIRGLRIPGINQTIEERLSELRKTHRSGDYRSFGAFDRSAANITSQESLVKLLGQMLKRNDPQYVEREARLQRRILNKMLAKTGNKDLIPRLRDLDDTELITLAQYTGFMETLEGSYAMAKSTSSDTPRWQSSVYEDNEEKIHDWVEWARAHFTDKDESEQDADDAGTRKTGNVAGPKRDRYGRFIGKTSLPDPHFARDSRGRFAPRNK